ncbi:MAG: SAM-dependent methyltransferase [Chthoniobacterales bacterium]|jgi:SAM-dependent methyltransferase
MSRLALFLLVVATATAGERLTVPTPQEAVDRMVELAELKPGENVYDLGCGDGRIVITAAQRRGVRAVGVDIDPRQVAKSRANVERAGVGDLVTIVEGDIYQTDFSAADVVFAYLQPDLLDGLIPQLRRMKPGSRIVTFDFGIDGAKPSRIERGAFGDRRHCTIYRYDVPWQDDHGTTWDIFTPSP